MKSTGLIGIDTGGTFTDVVYQLVDGSIRVFKVPSTPSDPSQAVLSGLESSGIEEPELVHGSTVATNALLERAGARCALVTTAGFEDLLLIGRQTRGDIYDLDVEKPDPLVPSSACFGLNERIGPQGEVIVALESSECTEIATRIAREGYDSVAICLLHSYANPSHELAMAAALRSAGVSYVSASCEVLPEFREFERCSTTTVNAYVGPVMDRYLENLERAVGSGVRIMQSNGGALSLKVARERAVETVLSGPAGGVVGAHALASAAGFDDIVTFDMGGTSTDVSLCSGVPSRTGESSLEGIPIRVTMLDIHTVGAGGGSVAWADPAGGLRVGPRSAGANPGPACYGQGGRSATVTDANLYLGRLSPDHFLGGTRDLDCGAARTAIEAIAQEVGGGPSEVAAGIVTIANSRMEGAIRVISVERGHDPRDFTLVCFGGAGGLHAAELAASLHMPRVLVPPDPGTLSAYGMLLADIVRDYSRTHIAFMHELNTADTDSLFEELEGQARVEVDSRALRLERTADLRYHGQGFELSVPWHEDSVDTFHRMHSDRYGYADRSRDVEVVTLRVRATVPAGVEVPLPGVIAEDVVAATPASITSTRFGDEDLPTPVYERTTLQPGARLAGPAVVAEYSSTTVIPPDWDGRVDEFCNLVLERNDA